jgi:glycerophosphoryl diester phosphodiesterase
VPTFAEVIALARRAGRGVYPELKHPTYFASIGLPMEDALLGALAEAGWTQKSDPVFVQCFEVGPLERLRTRTQLRLVQLIADEGGPVDRPGRSYRDMITPAGLAAVARYADGIGPAKSLVVPRGPTGARSRPPHWWPTRAGRAWRCTRGPSAARTTSACRAAAGRRSAGARRCRG